MIEIHNLNGFGKMVLANPPDPDRPISQENDFLSPVETATYRFCIDPRAKFFGGLDRSHIRRGILITNRKPFFVDFSLGKDGSQLCLTGLGDPRLILAVSPFGLGRNGGNTCPIDGDVELGNGRQERDYFPFHHLLTLPDRCDLNLPTNGLASTLHLLDGDHHIGQFFLESDLPSSNDSLAPTRAIIRRTPGENDVFSRSRPYPRLENLTKHATESIHVGPPFVGLIG